MPQAAAKSPDPLAKMTLPVLIQGGMGAGVSNWRLARSVSREGHLGVVAGAALDVVFVRRLQTGDTGGHIRRALASFPVPEIAERVRNTYFVEGGLAEGAPFKNIPLYSMQPPNRVFEVSILANYTEVYLAKEGHDGLVGINLLEKTQLPNLASLYGAMLADVDFVLMGAGIPREIPGILDRFVDHSEATLTISIADEPAAGEKMHFDPAAVMGALETPLKRPAFLAIVSSTVLATSLARHASGHVDGFIIEGHVAGGHNAPPRGKLALDDAGEPVYGEKDDVDLARVKRLGRPFWLAGAYGHREKIAQALAAGAAGVQVGTPFALCHESGLNETTKQEIFRRVRAGTLEVKTDVSASPTGFPFKLAQLPGTVSSPEVYECRERICDLGILRTAYRQPNGRIGFRCSGEPFDSYVRKGGALEDTPGVRCLCNGLLANIGLGQTQKDGSLEPPLVTCGEDLSLVRELLGSDATGYDAADVIQELIAD